MECQALTTVNLPNSLAYIGSSVFSGCSELTTVNLPNSLARIETLKTPYLPTAPPSRKSPCPKA